MVSRCLAGLSAAPRILGCLAYWLPRNATECRVCGDDRGIGGYTLPPPRCYSPQLTSAPKQGSLSKAVRL